MSEIMELVLVTVCAEVGDPTRIRRVATDLSEEYIGVVQQRDRWLRLGNNGDGVLLRHSMLGGSAVVEVERESRGPVTVERQRLTPVAEGARPPAPFDGLDTVARVLRAREIWVRDNVRIYLDTIPELGTFGVVEAVVDDAYPKEVCRESVGRLLRLLELPIDSLVSRSYAELMLDPTRAAVEVRQPDEERQAELERMKEKLAQLGPADDE